MKPISPETPESLVAPVIPEETPKKEVQPEKKEDIPTSDTKEDEAKEETVEVESESVLYDFDFPFLNWRSEHQL